LAKERDLPLLLPEHDINGEEIDYDHPEDRVVKSANALQVFMTDLRKYNLVDVFSKPISFMQTKKDIIATAVAHCYYLKSQNVPYAETRFAPQYHTNEDLTRQEAIYSAIEGFEKGRGKTGVDVRLIISIGREADPETGVEIVEDVIACHTKNPGEVLGIDLACEERGNPPEKHLPAFECTFGTSIRRTVHAGEMCDEETNLRNIRTAIYGLQAQAISQAIPLYKDRELVEVMVEKGIRLEANPISNHVFFGYNIEELHLDELIEAGVLVTINPDDPAMILNGDLVHNFYHLGKLYGNEFVDQVIRNSVQAAWGLSEGEKEDYLAELSK